jgi:hypothetical protein
MAMSYIRVALAFRAVDDLLHGLGIDASDESGGHDLSGDWHEAQW